MKKINRSIVSSLEGKLGLESGFFERLLKEDDWSFVIKLHALVDAACSNLLSYHFKEPGIETTLSMLELGNVKTGKIVFLRNLGLLSKEDAKVIKELGKIRNDFAHKISDAYLTLNDKYKEFDKNQRNNFLDAFPMSGAVAARLMREFLNLKTLSPIEQNDIVETLNGEYDLKLQIWSTILVLFIHFGEIEGFCDMRQNEKMEKP